MRNLVKPIQYLDHSLIIMNPPATAATDIEHFTVTKVPFWEIAKGTNIDTRYSDIANIAKVIIWVSVQTRVEQASTNQANTTAPAMGLNNFTYIQQNYWSQRKSVRCWLVATYGGNPANVQPTAAEVRTAFTDHYLPYWFNDSSGASNNMRSRGNPRHIRYKNNDIRVIKKVVLRERSAPWYGISAGSSYNAHYRWHFGYQKRIVLGRKLIVYNADTAVGMERPTGLFWICLWPYASGDTAVSAYSDSGSLPGNYMPHDLVARTYFYST